MDEEAAPPALATQLESASGAAKRLHVAVRGEELGTAQQETYLPLDDLTLRLYMSTESWSGAPSPEQKRLTTLAHRDLAAVLADLRPLLAETLPALATAAAEAGLAWQGELPAALPADLLPAYEE